MFIIEIVIIYLILPIQVRYFYLYFGHSSNYLMYKLPTNIFSFNLNYEYIAYIY